MTEERFPTRKLRDAHARGLRRRRGGPIIEIFEVEVAELVWFEQMYERLAFLHEQQATSFGMVRVFDTSPPTYDVRFADDEEALRHMLTAQFNLPHPDSAPGWPRVPYDVYFFAPDEQRPLYMVLENEDEAEERRSSDAAVNEQQQVVEP